MTVSRISKERRWGSKARVDSIRAKKNRVRLMRSRAVVEVVIVYDGAAGLRHYLFGLDFKVKPQVLSLTIYHY